MPLPDHYAHRITVLATAVNGSQPDQTFTVTYDDGSTSEFRQGVSDWHRPQTYPGESVTLNAAYRITPTGVTQNGGWRVYAFSFDVYSGTRLKSLTLPRNANVVVFAVNVSTS